jgi:LysM repeat protein
MTPQGVIVAAVGEMRRQGLRVVEVSGWRQRGRPLPYGPLVGVVFHHDASSRGSGVKGSLGTIVKGRSDVPGPLAQFQVGRDGTWFVVASGRSNHAGKGGAWRSVPRDSGVRYLIGVETANNGVDEPWSAQLLDSLDLGFACILKVLGRGPAWLIGHKEWAPGRKIDPGNIGMDRWRARVGAELRRITGQQPAEPPHKPTPVKPATTYVVKAGDSYWKIAQGAYQNGSLWKIISAANGDHPLKPGMKLTIPPAPGAVGRVRAAAAPARPAAPPAWPGKPLVRPGLRNGFVQRMQKRLIAKGFRIAPGPTGFYGPETKAAVAAFQRSRSELRGDPDGEVGPLTWKLLFS